MHLEIHFLEKTHNIYLSFLRIQDIKNKIYISFNK